VDAAPGHAGSFESSQDAVSSLCRAAMSSPGYASLSGVAVSRCSGARYAGVVYASDERATDLELLQDTVAEGPGPTALTSRRPVLVPDLRTHPHARGWVAFVDGAEQLGVRAVFAVPVGVGAAGLGLLTLHGTRPLMLSRTALEDTLRLSDVLGVALLAPDPSAWDGGLDGDHAVNHQAAGMVSVQMDVGLDEAMTALRAHAFAHDRTLLQVARDVVARRLSFRGGEPETDNGKGSRGRGGET
jgi:hypothetical protein